MGIIRENLNIKEIRSISVVLYFCVLTTAIGVSCSDQKENREPGENFKNFIKSEQTENGSLALYNELRKIPEKKPRKDLAGVEAIMHTLKPENNQGLIYTIGGCVKTVNADLDGDSIQEKICFRYLQYKEHDIKYTYISLILDIFKEKKQILRQELNRGYYYAESFAEMRDVNGDGKSELLTRVRFSPDCSGCGAYRIYTFKDDRFVLSTSLFNIKPDNPTLANLLDNIQGVEEMILIDYMKTSKSKFPCAHWEDCVRSDPWIVDLNDDGQLEVVFLVRPPVDNNSDADNDYNLFLAKYTKYGKLAGYTLQKIDLDCCDALVNVLGFIRTQDKHTHLLINFAYSGTSTGFPLLNVFDVQPKNSNKIGEFAGFYEHVIAERLRDLDEDGNTEIIYVGETDCPSGAAHAEVNIFYDIAEYRDGSYVEANEKFNEARDRLNDWNR